MSTIVSGQKLVKKFGDFTAVKGIDFKINKGACFGFLGPNGAGKSTTMKMLALSSLASGGDLSLFDKKISSLNSKEVYEIKSKIGIVPQEDNLDQELSVDELLTVFGRFYGLYGEKAKKRIHDILKSVDLEHKQNAIIRTLSGGMKRRLQIARGIMGSPQLLILDEPTTGLDPNMRLQVWDVLHQLKKQGVTLILTTHYMQEAESLCDELVIMDHGKIIVQGAPQELIRAHAGQYAVEVVLPKSEQIHKAEFLTVIKNKSFSCYERDDRIIFYVQNVENIMSELVHELKATQLFSRMSTLEDVFVKLTGHQLVEA